MWESAIKWGDRKDFHEFVQKLVLSLNSLMEHMGYLFGKSFEVMEGCFVLCY